MIRSALAAVGAVFGFFANLILTPVLALILSLLFGNAWIGYLAAFACTFMVFLVLLVRSGTWRRYKGTTGWLAVGYVVGGVIPTLVVVPNMP